MTGSSVARSGQETVPEYVWRGRGLFEAYKEELEYLGEGRWLIPSGTVADKTYKVRVGVRHLSSCECLGFQRYRHCSHIVCAELAHKKSAVCDACGERRWWPELREVEEDDELLSWYPGDVLCSACWAGHWS